MANSLAAISWRIIITVSWHGHPTHTEPFRWGTFKGSHEGDASRRRTLATGIHWSIGKLVKGQWWLTTLYEDKIRQVRIQEFSGCVDLCSSVAFEHDTPIRLFFQFYCDWSSRMPVTNQGVSCDPPTEYGKQSCWSLEWEVPLAFQFIARIITMFQHKDPLRECVFFVQKRHGTVCPILHYSPNQSLQLVA